MFKHQSQAEITAIWSEIWRSEQMFQANQFFKQRLFVEGYPLFSHYLPSSARLILDAGGGTGRYGLKLALDRPAARITVADISPESQRLGESLAASLGVQNISFVQEDLRQLSFSDNHFDAVLCDVVLQHLPDQILVLNELKRVLKPGGILVIANVNLWNFHTLYKFGLWLLGRPYRYGFERSYTHRRHRRLLTRQGFKIIAQDGFYPAYGLYRLKYLHPVFKFLGRAVNRLTKWSDAWSNRFFSRMFGMEIIVVGVKTR